MMTASGLAKIAAKTAAQICDRFELSEDAQPLLSDEQSPAQFLQTLIESELYADAARFLVHALPKREATWWACLCARDTAGQDLPPDVERTLRIAEQWVYTPTEENRQLAFSSVDDGKFDDPAYLAVAAAGWSGGSMNPPDEIPVPPPDALTPNAAFAAVMLAGTRTEPEQVNSKYREFMQRGMDIANGGSGKLE